MRMKRGVQQAAISALVFGGILLALVSVDPRVRERVTDLVIGSDGLTSLDARANDLLRALVAAVQHQSIENAPLLIFATVGAVLFVFMFKT